MVLLDPPCEQSVADLARRLRVHHATVSREVDRLEAAGLFRTHRLGTMRLVRADPGSPVLCEVRSLALKAFGPPLVLAEALAPVDGVEAAWIYGSWAEGVAGPPPQDLDMMVVGEPDRNQVSQAAQVVTERLGRPVHALVRSPKAWEGAEDGFLAKVRQGPMVAIPLEPDR